MIGFIEKKSDEICVRVMIEKEEEKKKKLDEGLWQTRESMVEKLMP